MHTYLISSRGTHESIPLEEVVYPTRNPHRVSGEIVISSNAFLYVEQKLGSYCRVSGTYLSHSVSTDDECIKFEYQRLLTIFMLATDGSIFPALCNREPSAKHVGPQTSIEQVLGEDSQTACTIE